MFVLAALGMILTFGDTDDLSAFLWTKLLAVPAWLAFVAAFMWFDRGGALTERLPKELLSEE